MSQENYAEALKNYREAEKLTKIPELYQSMAVCHLKLNQLEKALNSLKEGEQYKPENVEYFILMSDLYRLKENLEKSLVYIEKARTLFPDNAEAQQKQAAIKSLLEASN